MSSFISKIVPVFNQIAENVAVTAATVVIARHASTRATAARTETKDGDTLHPVAKEEQDKLQCRVSSPKHPLPFAIFASQAAAVRRNAGNNVVWSTSLPTELKDGSYRWPEGTATQPTHKP